MGLMLGSICVFVSNRFAVHVDVHAPKRCQAASVEFQDGHTRGMDTGLYYQSIYIQAIML